mgnify:CR=1 FL=1
MLEAQHSQGQGSRGRYSQDRRRLLSLPAHYEESIIADPAIKNNGRHGVSAIFSSLPFPTFILSARQIVPYRSDKSV